MAERRRNPALAVALTLAALFLAASGAGAAATVDPVDEAIRHWSALLRESTSTDETWTQARESSGPALARAEDALRAGRRFLALLRLAEASEYLSAAVYVTDRPTEQRKGMAAFETEWSRVGNVLRDEVGAPSPDAFSEVRLAAIRALGEAVLPQVRVYYEASLEYGRNTMPDAGLFYLGSALAQRDFARFCRTLPLPASPGKAPPVRAIGAEIEALERELLSAYRPPASIDDHTTFIRASATLKEARELNAAGLRYGALLRYLQASVRMAPLRIAAIAPKPEDLGSRTRALAQRLSTGDVDHSLGRLFLEMAASEPALSDTIVADVLPRYFSALEPPRPQAPRPAPIVTVTLVRWPYT
jgi:hypothetical protein